MGQPLPGCADRVAVRGSCDPRLWMGSRCAAGRTSVTAIREHCLARPAPSPDARCHGKGGGREFSTFLHYLGKFWKFERLTGVKAFLFFPNSPWERAGGCGGGVRDSQECEFGNRKGTPAVSFRPSDSGGLYRNSQNRTSRSGSVSRGIPKTTSRSGRPSPGIPRTTSRSGVRQLTLITPPQ